MTSLIRRPGPGVPTSFEFGSPPAASGHEFGTFLRRELQARNWSTRYLARRAGVNHSTISRLLTGQHTLTLETFSRLTRALDGPGGRSDARSNTPSSDYVRRVADSLADDPRLEPQGVEMILAYYLSLRTPAHGVSAHTLPIPLVRQVPKTPDPPGSGERSALGAHFGSRS